MPANTNRRAPRFVAVASIAGYSKLDSVAESVRPPRDPSPSIQTRANRPTVPANLRTEAEIAAWARSIVEADRLREEANANRENWNVFFWNGAQQRVGGLRKFVDKANEIGLNVFFKFVTTDPPCFDGIEDIVLCPAKKDPDWRRMPALVQSCLDTNVEFSDMNLSNGTQCVRITFND